MQPFHRSSDKATKNCQPFLPSNKMASSSTMMGPRVSPSIRLQQKRLLNTVSRIMKRWILETIFKFKQKFKTWLQIWLQHLSFKIDLCSLTSELLYRLTSTGPTRLCALQCSTRSLHLIRAWRSEFSLRLRSTLFFKWSRQGSKSLIRQTNWLHITARPWRH